MKDRPAGEDEQTWELSRFAPMLQEVVEDLVSGTLSSDEYPHVRPPQAASNGQTPRLLLNADLPTISRVYVLSHTDLANDCHGLPVLHGIPNLSIPSGSPYQLSGSHLPAESRDAIPCAPYLQSEVPQLVTPAREWPLFGEALVWIPPS